MLELVLKYRTVSRDEIMDLARAGEDAWDLLPPDGCRAEFVWGQRNYYAQGSPFAMHIIDAETGIEVLAKPWRH